MPAIMVNFDQENGTDPEGVHTKFQNVEQEWDHTDVPYWLQQLEMQLELSGVKSQWLKRLIAQKQFPQEIQKELKWILSKNKEQAGNTAYYDLKVELLKKYGPKKGSAYKQARQLVLIGKPSHLAKQLIDLLCKRQPPLQGCCREGFID